MKNILSIIVLIMFLLFKNKLVIGFLEGINLWYRSIFPITFLSIIISDYLLSSNIIKLIYKNFSDKFGNLFKTSNISLIILLISLLCGTPSNIVFINDLYKKGIIDDKNINRLINMSYLMNPFFIINFTNIKVYISLVLSSLVVFFITGKNNYYYSKNYEYKLEFQLTSSINKALHVSISILGYIVLFSSINKIIFLDNVYVKTFICGLLEVSNGLAMANRFNLTNIISIFLLSFNGLSILLQAKSILKDANLNLIYFIKYRLLIFIISAFIYLLCCTL